jgi:hypothetical protein
MQAFFFRLLALAIRFLCPLAALALSNLETMGAYYLFISYFTFVIGISTLELAIPFSRKFLRCKSEKQRQLVFIGFLSNQVVVTTILAIPAGVIVAGLAGVSTVLIPLLCLSLATEACVNEVGRFFWNIGEWKMPSLRDFIRAIVFATAIIFSVYIEREVLSALTFLILSVGNLLIMGREWQSWGGGYAPKNLNLIKLLKSSWLRVRRSLGGSIHQFLQMQLLGLQPLLERALFEKTVGLATLAAFSFITSVMQSAASLQLVPMIAKARQLILRARLVSEKIEANQQAILLGLNIAAISGVCALTVYMIMPFLEKLLEKEFSASPSLFLVAYISSVSAIFCSAVAPIFTVKSIALPTNLLTALAMTCLLVTQYFADDESAPKFLLIIICAVSLLQIIGRVLFIFWAASKLKAR